MHDMEIVRAPGDADAPAELISVQPWLLFLNGLSDQCAEPVSALMRGEALRLMLCGGGALVSASEPNLDLLRALITTVSGRFAGSLDDNLPMPSIRYHPALHHTDAKRAIRKAAAEPDTAFMVVAMDAAVVDPAWKIVMLAPSAQFSHPTLNFLRWAHANWELASMEDRLEVIARWAHGDAKPALKVVS